MFCKNCGKEINDDAVVCIHCGCSTGGKSLSTNSPEMNKKTLGVLLGLFLGLIGLIIGYCMSQANTEERATFMKGWTTGFIISITISVVIGIFYGGVVISLVGVSLY